MKDPQRTVATIIVPQDCARQFCRNNSTPVPGAESEILMGVSLANQIRAHQVRGNIDNSQYIDLVEKFHRIWPGVNLSEVVTCRIAIAELRKSLGETFDHLPTIDTSQFQVELPLNEDTEEALRLCTLVGCEVYGL